MSDAFAFFSDYTLAWPWLLLALPLPWLARWLLPARRGAAAALNVPYGARLDAIATGRGGGRAGAGNPWLWLAWALLCLAAARPQQLGEAVQPPQSGRDLMLAVDLSGSMAEEDMELGNGVVDRLTAAKAVLADFLDRRVGDRVGLLVFGQRAYALAPLTLDRESVRQQLLDSVVGLAGQETAIGDAIGLAVKRLRAQPAEQRVLILLTDGVSNAGMLDPIKAAELARDEHVRIHTIAFGGAGELSVFGFRLPVPGGGDDIDEAGLKRIADMTGGRAFRARDTAQLAGIYAEIDKLEPVTRTGKRVRPRIERYPWPLAACVLGLLLAFAMPRRMPARAAA
ncbi:vWA domain-containing protein [Luteimonas aquatica]|uniref:vWA domain-containing protein n=1 Tax=Luteimonas aquatica TaxID=450364 RepID=UPI001F58D6ED|nr:VWA domain-containing protein [Luteimonas aquatica]